MPCAFVSYYDPKQHLTYLNDQRFFFRRLDGNPKSRLRARLRRLENSKWTQRSLFLSKVISMMLDPFPALFWVSCAFERFYSTSKKNCHPTQRRDEIRFFHLRKKSKISSKKTFFESKKNFPSKVKKCFQSIFR